ncbi:thioredoxin [Candidatus Parcubacteria bacterium]|jgi:thioredoxin 1|nr:MAG: thioredoxin [Candidatus Parcubacteria bacterium]
MSEIQLTDQNFQAEVLDEKTKPVLVDFWAAWCGPCQVQGPIIEQVAKEIGVKAKVGKLDVDANPQTAMAHGVMSIPTLVIYKNGKPVWRVSGLQQKEAILKELEANLN